MKITKIISGILGAMFCATVAMARPTLPPPVPVATPVPDTHIALQLCIQDTAWANAQIVCGGHPHHFMGPPIKVEDNVILSVKSPTLPANITANVNGTPVTFTVDSTGSLGTYPMTAPGMWRMFVAPTSVYRGTGLMFFVTN